MTHLQMYLTVWVVQPKEQEENSAGVLARKLSQLSPLS
jgi:hypothetical protein